MTDKTERMQTHHAECWRNANHHACAVALCEELAAALEGFIASAPEIRGDGTKPERRWSMRPGPDSLAAARALLARMGRTD